MRIALIGAGRIGKVHAKAIASHSDVTFAAVADQHRPTAVALADQYNIRTLETEEVFEDETVDAILIASSTPTHADYLEKAARAGKAVLCEKPIALDLSRTIKVLETLKSHPVLCSLGFNRRHDPQFAALKKAIDEGQIGKVETLSIISRDPSPPPAEYVSASGGLFRDMMIHDFDMARWLLNEPITHIQATGSCLVDPAIGEAGDIDTAMVTMTTASGRLCHINNSRRACYGYDQRVEAFGSAGMLQVQNESNTRLRFTGEAGQVEEKPKWFFLERYEMAYRNEIDDFVRAWRNGNTPLAGALDGLEALRLAEAAERSLSDGCRIALNDVH
ncbi:inositol 2-dehydrogenase [Chromohalobacter beijerinckii]|uniref:Inositol 2-dehydrogenase n=1 Tax=Chromohalobacter beijerinckii TaxID=86179 RepID=A0ABV8XD04_9GAMM|nr:inositol 2-dehydrogenase [Chromohalobacter beijerinckii]MCK0766786.1 inositol 2-dehydrogenase [Chromohalobacter beijerinckii]